MDENRKCNRVSKRRLSHNVICKSYPFTKNSPKSNTNSAAHIKKQNNKTQPAIIQLPMACSVVLRNTKRISTAATATTSQQPLKSNQNLPEINKTATKSIHVTNVTSTDCFKTLNESSQLSKPVQLNFQKSLPPPPPPLPTPQLLLRKRCGSSSFAKNLPDMIKKSTKLMCKNYITEFKERFFKPIEPASLKAIRSFNKPCSILSRERAINIGVFMHNVKLDNVVSCINECDDAFFEDEFISRFNLLIPTKNEFDSLVKAKDKELPSVPDKIILKIMSIPYYRHKIRCLRLKTIFDNTTMLIFKSLHDFRTICSQLIKHDIIKLYSCISIFLQETPNYDGNFTKNLFKLSHIKTADKRENMVSFIIKVFKQQHEENPMPTAKQFRSFADFHSVENEFNYINNEVKDVEQAFMQINNDVCLNNVRPVLLKFKQQIQSLYERFKDIKFTYQEILKFFSIQENCSPQEFFDIWIDFVQNFHSAWNAQF